MEFVCYFRSAGPGLPLCGGGAVWAGANCVTGRGREVQQEGLRMQRQEGRGAGVEGVMWQEMRSCGWAGVR